MNAIIAVFKELVSLFVDDENLAIYCVILIFAAAFLIEFAHLPTLAGGGLLLVGCLGILVDSVARAVRKSK